MSSTERGSELVNYIPGLSPTRLVDLPLPFEEKKANFVEVIQRVLINWIHKAHYLLFPTVFELDPQAINALKVEFSFPIYTIGPAIPYTNILSHHSVVDQSSQQDQHYLQWLDRQPRGSVLYIALGSFLSVSSTQMDEIAAGLRESGVRFLWVVRREADRIRELVSCGGGVMGLVVPWCDQLTVLCHASVAGFWSHCGWNSVKEGVFAGVPFLTLPIISDQFLNSKVIVEDWKIGWRVKRDQLSGLVGREEIAGLVSKFMCLESDDHEAQELRRRVRELREICHCAIGQDGSSESNINAFLRDIS